MPNQHLDFLPIAAAHGFEDDTRLFLMLTEYLLSARAHAPPYLPIQEQLLINYLKMAIYQDVNVHSLYCIVLSTCSFKVTQKNDVNCSS